VEYTNYKFAVNQLIVCSRYKGVPKGPNDEEIILRVCRYVCECGVGSVITLVLFR
jgi:hypothetical protein